MIKCMIHCFNIMMYVLNVFMICCHACGEHHMNHAHMITFLKSFVSQPDNFLIILLIKTKTGPCCCLPNPPCMQGESNSRLHIGHTLYSSTAIPKKMQTQFEVIKAQIYNKVS